MLFLQSSCGIQCTSSLHKFAVNLFTNFSLLPLLTDQTANNFERASALALAKPTLIDFLEAKRSHSETLWMKYCSSRRNVRRVRVRDHDYRTRHKRHLCRLFCQKSFVAATPRPSPHAFFFRLSCGQFFIPFLTDCYCYRRAELRKKRPFCAPSPVMHINDSHRSVGGSWLVSVR